ncbi:MAG: Ku protein, partial [Bryobacteraceae bacterium]|nr:Ku protein [Bryobacteraceae bacterium]
MASTVWKGFLTFGLVSIPVKLSRAARPEKVSFRQLQASTGTRVRQALMSAAPVSLTREDSADEDEQSEPPQAKAAAAAPFLVPPSEGRPAEEDYEPREIDRSELVKGYEYSKDQYVTVSKEELAQITPETAREMQILEFVKLDEVDPVYFETSYYVSPDKGGEKAYSLLFAALKTSGLVGIAQLAMHNREHVVVLRPGRHGIILHTMFYETEIRQDDEFQVGSDAVGKKELDLALLLVN